MIIYEGKYGIKIIGKTSEYNKEIEKEYGKRHLAIVDEKNFKKYHEPLDEEGKYWIEKNSLKHVEDREHIKKLLLEGMQLEDKWAENTKYLEGRETIKLEGGKQNE